MRAELNGMQSSVNSPAQIYLTVERLFSFVRRIIGQMLCVNDYDGEDDCDDNELVSIIPSIAWTVTMTIQQSNQNEWNRCCHWSTLNTYRNTNSINNVNGFILSYLKIVSAQFPLSFDLSSDFLIIKFSVNSITINRVFSDNIKLRWIIYFCKIFNPIPCNPPFLLHTI